MCSSYTLYIGIILCKNGRRYDKRCFSYEGAVSWIDIGTYYCGNCICYRLPFYMPVLCCILYSRYLLTLAVHTPLGTDSKTGAYRWIKLGPITFQPTELMKIILIITLAALFSRLHSKLDKVSTLVKVCVVSAIPVLAILTQPDLSSSLVGVFIMCVMIFIGEVSYRIIVPILIAAVPICGFLAWYVQIPGNLILHNYQYNRIQAWLHPDTYPNADNLNWQQNSAIKAIASGQLYGKFIQDGGKGLESRTYNGVGIRESDFIWSVVGEEFGFWVVVWYYCCLQ